MLDELSDSNYPAWFEFPSPCKKLSENNVHVMCRDHQYPGHNIDFCRFFYFFLNGF